MKRVIPGNFAKGSTIRQLSELLFLWSRLEAICSSLDFRLEIDGKEVQHGNTSDMLFKVDEIIAYVSRFMTLKIGDLLFTGTPAGVGPVQIGQHLQGYLGEDKLLDFYIR